MKRLTKKEVEIIKKSIPKFKKIGKDLTADEIIESMEAMLNEPPVLSLNNRGL